MVVKSNRLPEMDVMHYGKKLVPDVTLHLSMTEKQTNEYVSANIKQVKFVDT